MASRGRGGKERMDGTAICIRCLDEMETEEIATAIPAAVSIAATGKKDFKGKWQISFDFSVGRKISLLNLWP